MHCSRYQTPPADVMRGRAPDTGTRSPLVAATGATEAACCGTTAAGAGAGSGLVSGSVGLNLSVHAVPSNQRCAPVPSSYQPGGVPCPWLMPVDASRAPSTLAGK